MNIAINATYAAGSMPTGVGNYTLSLIDAIKGVDRDSDFTLLYRKRISRENYPDLGFRSEMLPLLGSITRRNRYDVFHEPAGRYFSVGQSKTVVTVHDIVVAMEEDYTSEVFKRKQMPKLKKAVKNADRIITVSEFSKQELVKIFYLDPATVVAIPHGVDHDLFRPEGENIQAVNGISIPENYILFVGNVEKRKNITGLLTVFERLKKEMPDFHLLIVGKNGYGGDEIRRHISGMNVDVLRSIIQLDYVTNRELPGLYRKAMLMLFPSYYEGFGMTILEAMACGCPVVTSSEAAMPEAGGNAAVYVNPFDLEDIFRKTMDLISDDEQKRKLVVDGLDHAAAFTWKMVAEKTLDVYRSVL